MIRIMKLSGLSLRPLEDHLDMIGFEKYGILPPDPFMPSLDDLYEEDDDEVSP